MNLYKKRNLIFNITKFETFPKLIQPIISFLRPVTPRREKTEISNVISASCDKAT